MRPILVRVVIMAACILLSSCFSEKQAGNIIITDAEDIDIVLVQGSGENNMLPIKLLTKTRLSDFSVEFESERPLDYSIQLVELSPVERLPFDIWLTKNGFDWDEFLSIFKQTQQSPTIENQTKLGQYQTEWVNRYNSEKPRNTLLDYYVYQLVIGFEMNGDFYNNKVQTITFINQGQVIAEYPVSIEIRGAEREESSGLSLVTGSSIMLTNVPMRSNRYERGYVFTCDTSVEIQSLSALNEKYTIRSASIRVNNGSEIVERDIVESQEFSINCSKGSVLTVTPVFSLRSEDTDVISITDYSLIVAYRSSDKEETITASSGIVSSPSSYELLLALSDLENKISVGYFEYVSLISKRDVKYDNLSLEAQLLNNKP